MDCGHGFPEGMHDQCGICNPLTEEQAQAALEREMARQEKDPAVLANRARARREAGDEASDAAARIAGRAVFPLADGEDEERAHVLADELRRNNSGLLHEQRLVMARLLRMGRDVDATLYAARAQTANQLRGIKPREGDTD